MALVVPNSIRVLMPSGQVVVIKLETYLAGVVVSEMGANSPIEALKAQAVASRTYAASAHRHPERGADVCTTSHCQEWKRVDPVIAPEGFRAVSETWGIVAIHEGKLIEAVFHDHCDGHTRSSEEALMPASPYLRGVGCECGFPNLKGHGVGLCQRGAIVMARRGVSFEQILQHYYFSVVVIHTGPAPKPNGRPGSIVYSVAPQEMTRPARARVEKNKPTVGKPRIKPIKPTPPASRPMPKPLPPEQSGDSVSTPVESSEQPVSQPIASSPLPTPPPAPSPAISVPQPIPAEAMKTTAPDSTELPQTEEGGAPSAGEPVLIFIDTSTLQTGIGDLAHQTPAVQAAPMAWDLPESEPALVLLDTGGANHDTISATNQAAEMASPTSPEVDLAFAEPGLDPSIVAGPIAGSAGTQTLSPTLDAPPSVSEETLSPTAVPDYVEQLNAAALLTAEQINAAPPEAEAAPERQAEPEPVIPYIHESELPALEEELVIRTRRILVDHLPGDRIIAGSLTCAGIVVTIEDQQGNTTLVFSGSAPHYGEGGFETMVSQDGHYKVTINGDQVEVDMQGDTVFIHPATD